MYGYMGEWVHGYISVVCECMGEDTRMNVMFSILCCRYFMPTLEMEEL